MPFGIPTCNSRTPLPATIAAAFSGRTVPPATTPDPPSTPLHQPGENIGTLERRRCTTRREHPVDAEVDEPIELLGEIGGTGQRRDGRSPRVAGPAPAAGAAAPHRAAVDCECPDHDPGGTGAAEPSEITGDLALLLVVQHKPARSRQDQHVERHRYRRAHGPHQLGLRGHAPDAQSGAQLQPSGARGDRRNGVGPSFDRGFDEGWEQGWPWCEVAGGSCAGVRCWCQGLARARSLLIGLGRSSRPRGPRSTSGPGSAATGHLAA